MTSGTAWADRDFHALSEYILCFVVTCSYEKNKFEKSMKKKKKNASPGNLMMR
jgi:hypothetical protein